MSERPSPQPAHASAWRPIETAPKDGRALLLGYANSHGRWRTLRGEWMSQEFIDENWEEPDNGEPGWYETSVENDDVPNCWRTHPTHWQPLPAAPGASIPAPEGGQLAQALELLVDYCTKRGFETETVSSAYLAKARAALAAQPAPKLEDIEQYRLQMAGISTAALGYWKESDGILPDYDTVPLRDVAKLYAKYDKLFKEKVEAQANPPQPADLPAPAEGFSASAVDADEARRLADQLTQDAVAMTPAVAANARRCASMLRLAARRAAPAEGELSEYDWLDLPGAVAAWNRVRRAARALSATGSIAETLDAAAALADLVAQPQPKRTAVKVEHHEFSAARKQWRATIWTDEALPTGTQLYTVQSPAPAQQVPPGWVFEKQAEPLEGHLRIQDPSGRYVYVSAGCLDTTERMLFDLATTFSQAPAVKHAMDVEAAAKKLAKVFDYEWDRMPETGRITMRVNAAQVLAAAMGTFDVPVQNKEGS